MRRAGFRRLELSSQPGEKGEYRCPVCDNSLEVFDGSKLVVSEAALASRGLMTWSADITADDWKRISGAEVAKRAISGIEAKGRGIVVLHDIHERAVEALPTLLAELKLRGFKIVQIVPATATLAKTETTPDQWQLHEAHSSE